MSRAIQSVRSIEAIRLPDESDYTFAAVLRTAAGELRIGVAPECLLSYDCFRQTVLRRTGYLFLYPPAQGRATEVQDEMWQTAVLSILRVRCEEPEPEDVAQDVETQERTVADEQLGRVLPEVAFDGVDLGEALNFFRDITGADIFINWRAIAGVGISRTAGVNLHLRDVSIAAALRSVLDHVGGEGAGLGFTVEDDVITIAPRPDVGSA